MTGSPEVSIRDVAQRAGVALGTVSNVLNRPTKVAPATRERVREAITELGFVRNEAARQLRAGRSRTIGMIVLDVQNPFFTDVARGADKAAAQSGLSVLLANSDEMSSREAAYIDLFEEQRVHGLLIFPIGEVFTRLNALRGHGIPTVLVDRTAEGYPFSSVSVDDVAGGELATAHLIAQGRRRIAFAGGPMNIAQITDRLAGARAAAAELTVFELPVPTAAAGRDLGDQLAALPTRKRPDAIFAANDLIAVGLLQSLMAQGIAVPDEIALVGYDDIDFASAAAVPLTSIRQPSELIGETAVSLLVAESAATKAGEPVLREQVIFQPELVIRASS